MNFNAFVNRESFKAIVLQHLKGQVRAKFGPAIRAQVRELEGTAAFEDAAGAVSRTVLNGPDFGPFESAFLESLGRLLGDGSRTFAARPDPPPGRRGSSASSVDFLSPDRLQAVVRALSGEASGAERLEALASLHRFPTLDHLVHHFSWPDVESGLRGCLADEAALLRVGALRLYVRILGSPEPKAVQAAFLSLVGYLLDTLLPSLCPGETERCRTAAEVLSVLNRFLRSVSSHWLRYPQSLIESITVRSLALLQDHHPSFPVRACTALCDPEAGWVRNLLHGHLGRGFLLAALGRDPQPLRRALDFCRTFRQGGLPDCRPDAHHHPLVLEVTHVLCLLGHLLRYSEGRAVLGSVDRQGCWTDVLALVTDCAWNVCSRGCSECGSVVCENVPAVWGSVWNNRDPVLAGGRVFPVLHSLLSDASEVNANQVNLVARCFSEMVSSYCSITRIDEDESRFNGFVQKLLVTCVDHLSHDNSQDAQAEELVAYHLLDSSLGMIKILFSLPLSLFLQVDFLDVLSRWLEIVTTFNPPKSGDKNRRDICSKIDRGVLDVSVSLLSKPTGVQLCHGLSRYEQSLNILLEKILADIQAGRSVCPCDVSVLSASLNGRATLVPMLNATSVFRLSSVLWQLQDAPETRSESDADTLAAVLGALMPSVFHDPALSVADSATTEADLFERLLLFPRLGGECVAREDCHVLALRVASLLSTSIDCLCVMEARFAASEVFLGQLAQRRSEDGRTVIDPVSLLLNHVAVKLNVIGGGTEKRLPPESVESGDVSYDWPFVTGHPVPDVFLGTGPYVSDSPSVDVSCCVESGSDLKDMFLDCLRQKGSISFTDINQFLKAVTNIGTTSVSAKFTDTLHFADLDDAGASLSEEELSGVPMVRRYGERLGLVSGDSDPVQLLKAAKSSISSGSRLDVFVCSVYLMCRGDSERAWRFLRRFATTASSVFVWKEIAVRLSDTKPLKHTSMYSMVLELCDVIVKRTLPAVFSALGFRQILPSVFFDCWTSQCYWNFLDFVEVSHFVLFTVLFSGEYSLYFFVAVLKHLKQFILKNSHDANLYCLLIKGPIEGFRTCDHLDFMHELSSTFHELMSNSLSTFL